MASAETLLTLEADEGAVVSFLDECGGLLFRDEASSATYWLVLHSKRDPAEAYYARVAWNTYPEAPPSVAFADGIGGSTNITRAWPNIPGYRIGSWDICKPFTSEGFNIHPDWRTGTSAWSSTGNPLLFVVQTLQHDLNDSYNGRQP